MPESPVLAESAAGVAEGCQWYLCPACGRLVASTGPIYGALRGDRLRRYVYLRPHKAAGRWCGQASARVLSVVPRVG